MANGHGGSRTPARPAAVSGPGRYSRRTDGRQPVRDVTGGSYGDGQELRDLQGAAPMAEAPTGASAAGAAPMPIDTSGLTPLGAPSAQPGGSLLDGLDQFDPGMEPTGFDEATRERLAQMLPTLLFVASSPRASEQTRDFVRRLRAEL